MKLYSGPLSMFGMKAAIIAFFMAALFGERMGAQLNEQTPQLLQWRERMVNRPSVVLGIAPLKNHLINAGRPVPAFMR